VKKTRAYGAVDFNDGRDPRGVADWGLVWELAEMLSEVAGDLSKFGGRFNDVSVIDAGFIFENELLDLIFQCLRFFEIQTYFTLLFAWPYKRAVECLRGKIGSKERD
jgi:hypothetical protein